MSVFLEATDVRSSLIEKSKGLGGGSGVEYANSGRVPTLSLVLWYFGFGRLVDEPVFLNCPSSLSLTSDPLLPFPLMMERTKMTGLETEVSSHVVLHNKSVLRCSRQSQSQ